MEYVEWGREAAEAESCPSALCRRIFKYWIPDGSIIMMLWLQVMGVDDQRWTEQVRVAGGNK